MCDGIPIPSDEIIDEMCDDIAATLFRDVSDEEIQVYRRLFRSRGEAFSSLVAEALKQFQLNYCRWISQLGDGELEYFQWAIAFFFEKFDIAIHGQAG